MLDKPRILSHFPTRLINSIKHEHSCKSTRCEKEIKCSASLAFYLFFPTRLINSIIHEHSCKILYLFQVSVLDVLLLQLAVLCSVTHQFCSVLFVLRGALCRHYLSVSCGDMEWSQLLCACFCSERFCHRNRIALFRATLITAPAHLITNHGCKITCLPFHAIIPRMSTVLSFM